MHAWRLQYFAARFTARRRELEAAQLRKTWQHWRVAARVARARFALQRHHLRRFATIVKALRAAERLGEQIALMNARSVLHAWRVHRIAVVRSRQATLRSGWTTWVDAVRDTRDETRAWRAELRSVCAGAFRQWRGIARLATRRRLRAEQLDIAFGLRPGADGDDGGPLTLSALRTTNGPAATAVRHFMYAWYQIITLKRFRQVCLRTFMRTQRRQRLARVLGRWRKAVALRHPAGK